MLKTKQNKTKTNQSMTKWTNNKGKKYGLTKNLNNPDFKLKQKCDSNKPDNTKLSSRQRTKKKRSYLKNTFLLYSFLNLKKKKNQNAN